MSRSVFAGTEGGGLAMIRDGRAVPFGPYDGFASMIVTTISRDGDGALWVGTYDRGVFRLRDGKWTSLTTRDGLPANTITALLPDGDAMWVGTLDGLSRVEQGRVAATFGLREGLRSSYVVAIHRDGRGVLWVATGRGAAKLDGARFTSAIGSRELPVEETYSLHEDERGTIWAGMHNGVLAIDPDGTWRVMSSADGIPRGAIYQVEQDRRGDFWLTCSAGVVRVARGEMQRHRVARFDLFNTADGLKSAEPTWGAQPGSWAAADGSIWFATIRGAARLDPDAAAKSTPPPRALLEEIDVDGRPQPLGGDIDVPPGSEKLEFRYTAPSFVAPSRVRFRYRLVGYDKAWIDAGGERVARYTHLPPGNYRFIVAASDGPEAQASLVLHPRFTQTVWFYVLCVLAAGLAAAAAFLAHVRRIRSEYAAVLAERNRIAREFHDTLAQSLIALTQQFHLGLRSLDEHLIGDARRAVELANRLSKECLTETRRSLLDLRSGTLEREGLAAALQAIAAHARKISGLAVTAAVSGRPRRLEPAVELHILRIAQEAVTNAVRHSGAQTVDIALDCAERSVELTIADDGNGPPPSVDSAAAHLGLIGIRERAHEIGGEVDGARNASGGTTVRLTVPVAEQLTERRAS